MVEVVDIFEHDRKIKAPVVSGPKFATIYNTMKNGKIVEWNLMLMTLATTE